MDKASRNKDAVTQRILETTQETQRLKQELQSLIAAGISGNQNYNLPTSRTNIPLESTNKVQIIKSYDPKHSQHSKKPLEDPVGPEKATDPLGNKNKVESLSPKKPKGYDVHQAKEYIKKQRDKRKEELKTKKTESQVSTEMRKEKLLELQKKASELVKKNVEAKRQRSKSRDRTGTYVQPVNDSDIMGFNCAKKTKKHLEQPLISSVRSQNPLRNPNLLYPPEPAFCLGGKSAEAVRNSKSLQNLLHPPEPHYNRDVLVQSNVSVRAPNVASVVAPNVTSVVLEQQDKLKGAQSKSTSHRSTESLTKHKSPKKGTSTSQSRDTSRVTDVGLVLAKDQISNYSESLSHKPITNKNLSKESQPKKDIKILSNITLKSADQFSCQAKNQKQKVVTPEWLKDTGEQGDPYNFINTVKRQLKYVVSEKKPACVDVGVQGNIESDISEHKTSNISKKSDLKSFMSHKCLNLDPHIIQHIELNMKKSNPECKDGPTITNPSMSSDYDSDTSKNIPSISSESGTSLRRNAEFVMHSYVLPGLQTSKDGPPNLDTKKVEDIKLRNPGKLSNSEINTQKTSSRTSIKGPPLKEDVERIKKQLFKTESDCYSTDFIPTDLSKSRNSLISFNCAKVSPNRIPDHYKSRSDNLVSPSANTNTHLTLETEPIIISSTSQPSGISEEGSQRKSSFLNSVSTEGPQNRQISSAQFYSLNSELQPSVTVTDPEIILVDRAAHLDISELSSSQVRTDTSEKNEWKSDGFTEVLKPKKMFSDSDGSQWAASDEFSKNTETIPGIKGSEKSTGELYKSKSEQIVSRTRNAGVFSKSDSNINEDKENLKKMYLKEPKLSLNVGKKNRDESTRQTLMKNISIRSGDQRINRDKNNTNEIHLKFEAEIHLLNDFNQSLKHFSEIEKAFESLRSKNQSEMLTKKVLHNRDTQTSIIASSKTVSKESDTSNSQISTINYKRGSGRQSSIDSIIHSDCEDNTEVSRSAINSEIQVITSQDDLEGTRGSELSKRSDDKSENLLELIPESDLTTVLNSVNLEETEMDIITEKSTSVIHLSQVDDIPLRSENIINENLAIRNFAGMSLRMFDQLIKDEDARIENWKKIVKIREQALLDRTRGELVYLEIQKKQLIETGKMTEASLIKKKQRGILLKHQQEKHEMQRLKQMQKEASAKRKTLLKTEKNVIKNQLLSDNMVSKLKTTSNREKNERRLSGPLKVIQATGSVHSETSLLNGTDQQIKNITTRRTCSLVLSATSDNIISDVAEPLELSLDRSKNINAEAISSMKKRLLMREHALAKRRKTVEELLQWHKKLLEEEKAIEDLESKVEKIISKIPSGSNEQPTKDTQDLSRSISEKTFDELNTPSMSQVVLDRLLPSKEMLSLKTNSISLETNKNIPQEENVSEDSNKVVSSANYSTDFDVDSVPEVLPQNSGDQSNVSSISQLIENFSKIKDNILSLSLVQRRHSLGSEDVSSVKSEGAKTISSSVAEDIIEDKEKSEASSHSIHITSEVEVKPEEELPREVIQNEKQQDQVEDSDASVIIIEESSHIFTDDCEENKPVSLEEIKEDSTNKKNKEEISENLWTVQSESKNAPTTSLALALEKLSKESVSEELESVSVGEEVGEEIVPDDSSKISLGDVANKTLIFKISDDKPVEARKVSEDISTESNREEENLSAISPAEQPREEVEEDLQQIIAEIEPNNASKDRSLKTLEEFQKTSQDVNIAVEVCSENSSHIQEASKPSTSHDKSAENSAKVENIPSTSHKSSYNEIDQISDPVLSEEPPTYTSKGDVSTSKQYEEIEEYEVSNVDIPSTSHQAEEQATTSKIVSLSKDDVSNIIEQEPQNHSSISTPGIPENEVAQSSSIVEEERQSFENKTDEEKVASLSIRATGNQSGSSSITRPSSLVIPEASVSGTISPSTSRSLSKLSEGIQAPAVSEKPLLSEANDVLTSSTQTSITDKESNESDEKDAAVRKHSKGSSGSRIDSVEGKLSEISSVQESSVPIEERSGSASKQVSKEISSTSSVQEQSLATEEKSVEVSTEEDRSVKLEDNQSETSPVPDISVSAAKSLVVSDEKTSVSTKSPTVSSEKLDISSQKSNVTPEKSPRLSVDVKKRVQEILNEASPVSRGDKSPRMQDLCVMTYDLISPTQSPESGSPLEDRTKSFSLGSEAEELLKKQLAIEQEIKLLTEQQQKEEAPQFYIREIPNKPPPPYTPPSKAKAPKTPSIIPSSKEEIEQITEYSAKIIHKGYLSNNLDNISISDNTLNLIAKNIDKGCYKYVFDLCKEIAVEHYSQFTIESGPSWLQLEKKLVLAPAKPLDVKGLKKLMYKKLLELFGFEKQEKKKENTIMKWSRKKRDHVDEVLVQEMQAEENSWTNFDRDELLVKDRITNEIMEMLLKETAQVLKKTVQKKNFSQ